MNVIIEGRSWGLELMNTF